MKVQTDQGSTRPPHGQRKLSVGTRIAARLTGTSLDELTRAPDDEHKAVRLGGLTLVLISVLATLGWFVALGIARGRYAPENLPFALLAGVIIFAIDRAILRRLWAHAGRRAAAVGWPTATTVLTNRSSGSPRTLATASRAAPPTQPMPAPMPSIEAATRIRSAARASS